MVANKPLPTTPSQARQVMLQVGPPGPLRRQARALPQWTQGVCLDLPFTTWTQPMRPGSGRPSPNFGVARSSPRGQLIRLTGWLPTDLAVRLLALLERGPVLVGAEAARLRDVIDLNDPTTPALAVVTLGWLEAAEQVLTAGSTAQDLQVLVSVAGRQG